MAVKREGFFVPEQSVCTEGVAKENLLILPFETDYIVQTTRPQLIAYATHNVPL